MAGPSVPPQSRTVAHHVAHILELKRRYSPDDIVVALEHALCYHAYDARAIDRVLATQAIERTLARGGAVGKRLEPSWPTRLTKRAFLVPQVHLEPMMTAGAGTTIGNVMMCRCRRSAGRGA